MTYNKDAVYFPLLDATRFVAFIPVFLTHCFITSNVEIENALWFKQVTHFLNIGLLGLDYFFVLSSFLITRIIIEEKNHFNSFNFKFFFVRRSLRIWPLYFLMILLGYITYYSGILNNSLPPFISFASFTLNLYISNHGYDFLFFLVILWSISVEEQFYIFWGGFLYFLSFNSISIFKAIILIVGFLFILISLMYRYTHNQNELQLYFHTLSVMGNFGVGIILAWLSVYSKVFLRLFDQFTSLHIGFIVFVIVFSIVFYTNIFIFPLAVWIERMYFSIIFALIIAVLCFSPRVKEWQKFFSPFNYLGKISLGLYFYHAVVITIFSKLMMHFHIAEHSWQVMFLNPIFMLSLSILLASLSYNYFEKPILALKNNFYRKD